MDSAGSEGFKAAPGETDSLRHPSAAELDAYARRTAGGPLSIKIFPANIRVPQHKQISRTVNGLDTRFGSCPHPYPYASSYQGLLAIVKSKGVWKSCDGKRAKLSPIQMAVAPYAPPSSWHRQRPYGSGSHAVARQIQPSPSFAPASCAESTFPAAQNGITYSGAVLPTQSADVAGSGSDQWHRAPHVSPEVCHRSRPLDKLSPPPFSGGQFFAPAWNSVSDSDCYNPQALPAGSSMGAGHARPPPYPTGLCRVPPGNRLCQASLLSTSLQSLESLVSEIRPPCIKERMLGRADAPQLPLARRHAHPHMPVLR